MFKQMNKKLSDESGKIKRESLIAGSIIIACIGLIGILFGEIVYLKNSFVGNSIHDKPTIIEIDHDGIDAEVGVDNFGQYVVNITEIPVLGTETAEKPFDLSDDSVFVKKNITKNTVIQYHTSDDDNGQDSISLIDGDPVISFQKVSPNCNYYVGFSDQERGIVAFYNVTYSTIDDALNHHHPYGSFIINNGKVVNGYMGTIYFTENKASKINRVAVIYPYNIDTARSKEINYE